MSVVIRLTRTGKKHSISYRVVATDKLAKRDGKFLEILGYWLPQGKKDTLNLKKDRIEYWISKGAQPSPTVKSLIATGTVERKKKPIKQNQPEQKSAQSNNPATQ